MKNPNKLVTIAKNMSKVYDAGRDAVISNTVKEVGSIRPQSHSLYPLTKQIADNVERIYEAGQASAEALKREASGAIVSVNDVNSVEHDVPVVLSSKNLLPYPHPHATHTSNGITFTDNGDGTVTLNGTTTGVSMHYLANNLTLPAGTYTIVDSANSGVTLWKQLNGTQLSNSDTFTIEEEGVLNLRIRESKTSKTFNDVVCKIMIIKGVQIPSDYTPYRDDFSSVTVSQCGKNLFDYSGWVDSRHITVLDEASGEIKFTNVSGISAAAKKIAALPNTSYRISGYVKDTVADHWVHISPNYTDGANDNVSVMTSTEELGGWKRFEGVTRSDKTLSFISFGGGGGLRGGTSFKEIQVELADEATAYEPHAKGDRAVKADGTVLGKNLLTYPYTQATKTENGITFTDNGDGTITINGTATAQAVFYFHGWSHSAVNIKEGETYTLSGAVAGVCWLQCSNSVGYPTDEGAGKTFVAGAGGYYFYIIVKAGTTANNVVIKPQVELGTAATDYSPYTNQSLRSISPSMTVSTDTDGALINLTYYAAEAE